MKVLTRKLWRPLLALAFVVVAPVWADDGIQAPAHPPGAAIASGHKLATEADPVTKNIFVCWRAESRMCVFDVLL